MSTRRRSAPLPDNCKQMKCGAIAVRSGFCEEHARAFVAAGGTLRDSAPAAPAAKSTHSAPIVIDASDSESESEQEYIAPPRKRGRPPGSKNKVSHSYSNGSNSHGSSHRSTTISTASTSHTTFPSTPSTTSAPSTASQSYDIFEEHPRDPRHQQSALSGCYLVHPVHSQPSGFVNKEEEYKSALEVYQTQKKRTNSSADNTVILPPKLLDESGLCSLYTHESLPSISARARAITTLQSHATQLFTRIVHRINTEAFTQIAAFIGTCYRSQRRMSTGTSSISSQHELSSLSPAIAAHLVGQCGSDELPVALIHAGINVTDHHLLFQQLCTYLSQYKQATLSPASTSSTDSSTTTSIPSSLPTPTPYTVTLRSATCSAHNIESLWKQLYTQFTTNYGSSSGRKEKALRSYHRSSNVLSEMARQEEREKQDQKKQKDYMLLLYVWYQQQVEEAQQQYVYWAQKHAPSSITVANGSAATEGHTVAYPADIYPKLVVILEDTERFDSSMLTELFTQLLHHPYMSQLPFTLLLGLATHVNILHSLLPASILNRLWCSSYALQPANEIMHTVTQHVLNEQQLGVQLDTSTLKWLLEFFESDNRSISTLLQVLHYIIVEHLDSAPLSQLCTYFIDRNEQPLQALTPAELDYLLDLPSIQQHFFDLPKDTVTTLRSNQAKFHEYIIECIHNLYHHQAHYWQYVELMYATCTRYLSHHKDLTKQQLYLELLTGDMTRSDILRPLLPTLQQLPISDVKELVKLWRTVINNQVKAATDESVRTSLSDVQRELEELAAAMEKGQSAPAASNVPQPAQHIRTPNQRRNALLATANQSIQQAAPTRQMIVGWLTRFIAKHLCPLSQLPAHEIFYFQQASNLRYYFQSRPRVAVINALSNSKHYLRNCEEDEPLDFLKHPAPAPQLHKGTTLSNELEDISIVYGTFLESSKIINLYDWFQTFKAIVTNKPVPVAPAVTADTDMSASGAATSATPRKRGRPAKKLHAPTSTPAHTGPLDREEKELQARFMTCLSTLRFLGYIKETGRKQDHVAKATHEG